MAEDEVWKVQCPFYGLTESPGDCAAFKNALVPVQWRGISSTRNPRKAHLENMQQRRTDERSDCRVC